MSHVVSRNEDENSVLLDLLEGFRQSLAQVYFKEESARANSASWQPDTTTVLGLKGR